MKHYKFITVFLFMGIALYSCKKLEFDKIASTAWNPNLALPLGYGTFDIYDIFQYHDTTDLVVIDPNTGLVALVYRSDLLVATAEDFVSLEQMSQSILLDAGALNIPINATFNGTITANNQQNIAVGVNSGVEVHNFHLKSGIMTIQVSTNLAHNVTSVITLPGLTINGNPVQQTVQLNYSGTVPHTGTAIFNIGGAQMDCTVNNSTVNTLQVNTQNTITGTGSPLTGSENVTINFTTSNMAFDLVQGYFGQQTVLDLQDSVLIKLFENGDGNGYFELTNPSLKLFVENSLGVPVRLNLSNLRTINVYNNQEFFMANYPAIHDINYPSVIGGSANTLIEFNTVNTPNLANVIAPVPQHLAFGLSALTNPNGPGASLNFLRDTSKVRVRSELEMPLIGFAHGFGAKDTFNFNLPTSPEEIESIMFRLIIDNGFPVKINAQLRFMDENYNALFTAWDVPVLAVDAGLVNTEGVVVQRKIKITDVVVGEDKIDLLPQVKYVEVDCTAKTKDALTGQIIKIFDWYNIHVKLGMQVQAKIKL